MWRYFTTSINSRFSRFVIAGGIAAIVNILSRIVLSQFMTFGVAVVVAYLVGMTTAYLMMRQFVFDSSGKSVPHEYIRFGFVNLIGLVQVWTISVGLARWFVPLIHFHWHPETVAHLIGVLSPVATSYVGHKLFTFARSGEHETRAALKGVE